MVKVKLFVEGGGTNNKALENQCRAGFSMFITKANIKNRPRVIACGSRKKAYDDFRRAVENGEEALLLIDSEAAIAARHQQGQPDTWQPWTHLKDRVGDGWDKPAGVSQTQCHLMVQVMESWLLADRNALKAYFDQGFRENALPSTDRPIETVAKRDLYEALKQATRQCKTKAAYDKGAHSFELLAKIDPAKVTQASPWAKRFVDELRKRMDA